MRTRDKLAAILISILTGIAIAHADSAEKLDLNSASKAELIALPGIGPASAEAIIRERDKRGGFRSVDDLLKVHGIGRKLVARLRPLITAKSKSDSATKNPFK